MVSFSDKNLSKIRQAIGYSRRQLQPFRQQRYEVIRQYVGYHYSDDGASDRVPVNLLELAINIYTQQMAARIPQVLVSTIFRQLKPTAANFELAINHLLNEIKFGETIRLAVIDALFSLGIIKSGTDYRWNWSKNPRRSRIRMIYNRPLKPPTMRMVILKPKVYRTVRRWTRMNIKSMSNSGIFGCLSKICY